MYKNVLDFLSTESSYITVQKFLPKYNRFQIDTEFIEKLEIA